MATTERRRAAGGGRKPKLYALNEPALLDIAASVQTLVAYARRGARHPYDREIAVRAQMVDERVKVWLRNPNAEISAAELRRRAERRIGLTVTQLPPAA